MLLINLLLFLMENSEKHLYHFFIIYTRTFILVLHYKWKRIYFRTQNYQYIWFNNFQVKLKLDIYHIYLQKLSRDNCLVAGGPLVYTSSLVFIINPFLR